MAEQATEPEVNRAPTCWLTYPGDHRDIVDMPVSAPNLLDRCRALGKMMAPALFGDATFADHLGLAQPVGFGPTTFGESMWPVEAHYDVGTDSTRVGFSYVPPSR